MAETTHPPEIFTAPWADAWCREIHGSETYRRAAAGWQGAIVFVMTADPEMGIGSERAVFLDLADGACRGGRTASDEDRRNAVFVLRATPAIWKRVLQREIEPIWGLMSGKLELAEGSIAKLIPYTRAAKEMVECAARLDTSFPGGWHREDDTP